MTISLIERFSTISEFGVLTDEERAAIAALSVVTQVSPGEIICEQEEEPSGIYLVLSGQLNILNIDERDNPSQVDTLHEGALFAQHAIRGNYRATFRAQAGDNGAILEVIYLRTLKEYFTKHPQIWENVENACKFETVIDSFTSAPGLREFPREALLVLATNATSVTVPTGTFLIKQGEKADDIFVIQEGSFAVTRDEAPNHRIAVLNDGDLAGEMAIIRNNLRSANVIAERDSTVFRVSGDAFRDLVKTHEDLAKSLDELMRVRLEQQEAETQDREKKNKEVADRDQERRERLAKAKEADKAPGVEITRPSFSRFRKPPAIRQHSEMDCSAACLSTVCRYYGKRISINTTRDIARVRQDGASMENVMRAAETLGFKIEGFISTLDQLRQKQLPAIVNWRGYHWVVVYEVTDSKVLIADPDEGLVTYTIEEFTDGWSLYTIFMEPTAKFERLEETGASLRAFANYYRPYSKTIAEIFLAAVALQAVAIMLPLFTKFIVDDIVLKGDEQWLVAALVVMAGVIVLEMILSYRRDDMLLRVTMMSNYGIIGAVYERLLSLPIDYFERRKVGDITTRLEQHEEITEFVTEDGFETFLDIMTSFAYLAFMLFFNVWLTLAAVLFLLLDILVIMKISPILRQIGRETFVKESDQESHLIESIRGAATLKTIGADHIARWEYENHFAAVSNMQFKEAKYSQMAGIISGTVDSLSDIAVLFLGATFVIWGELTIGEMIAFTVFANGLQAPINDLIGKWDELQEVYVAVERLNDIMENEPEFTDESENTGRESLPRLQGGIRFDKVAFRYEPDDQQNIVQDISFEVKAGQRVAFVGTSGCGKSTLIKLLYGFYKATEGRGLVDGFDTREITLQSLRRQIAMVPQESVIFRATVRENIAIAREDATLDEIIEAATLAAADEFISEMPAGYDTMLEEQGSNLSGGQRQRLIIARAFLQDASLLILDEATSALDTETERMIMENVATRYADKTIIMIAHRLSTIRSADLIIALNQGIVVEAGTHDELMEKRGYYYHLSARQLVAE